MSIINKSEEFKSLILNPLKFKVFLFRKVPMAYLAGIKVTSLDDEKAVVTLPYKFLNKNPFNSIYFACLAMAAELSTGVLAMMKTYKSSPPVAFIVTGLEAQFTKKAMGKITFKCNQGGDFETAVSECIATGEPRQLIAESIGVNEKGDQVARFAVTWSFKPKLNEIPDVNKRFTSYTLF